MSAINVVKIILILFAFVVVSTGLAKAVTDGLPQITTACENRHGFLFSVNDGFSILKKCPNNFREVILVGQPGPKGDQGDPGPLGLKGDKGEPGNSGFTPDKEVNVCFDVSTGNIKVLQFKGFPILKNCNEKNLK